MEKTRSRSAKTGKFVTKKYAKKHPSTIINETIKEMDKSMDGAMFGVSTRIHFKRAFALFQKLKKQLGVK